MRFQDKVMTSLKLEVLCIGELEQGTSPRFLIQEALSADTNDLIAALGEILWSDHSCQLYSSMT